MIYYYIWLIISIVYAIAVHFYHSMSWNVSTVAMASQLPYMCLILARPILEVKDLGNHTWNPVRYNTYVSMKWVAIMWYHTLMRWCTAVKDMLSLANKSGFSTWISWGYMKTARFRTWLPIYVKNVVVEWFRKWYNSRICIIHFYHIVIKVSCKIYVKSITQ